MPRPDRIGCCDSRVFELIVGAGMAYQAWPGCFTKGDAEFHSWDRLHHCFIKVLYGLYEVRLSDNYVEVRIRFRNFDYLQVHMVALFWVWLHDDNCCGGGAERA